MTETGCPQTAAENGNKRKIQHNFFTTSFLATHQEENGQQDTVACVDSSVDSGIFYLNPLTPKWNCGIAEKSLEITSDGEEIWIKNKDNGKCNLTEKTQTSKLVTKKHEDQKHYLIQQTPNRISMDNIADFSSTSSGGIWLQNLDNVDKIWKTKKTASKQQVISKLRLHKVKKHNFNEQSANGTSGIIKSLSDSLTSSSGEKDIWVSSTKNATDTLARAQVTPEILVKDNCTNPQSKQSTNVNNQEHAKYNEETKMEECDKEVMSKLKGLHVKGDNSLEVSAKNFNMHGTKISRLLEAMKKRDKIDSEQRPFKCPHCHWAFKKLCYLQSHLTTHSGLKPHVCDICGKAYSHQGTLQQHKRLHTGERPYHCPFCERSYIWSSDYRKHIRTHTGEKPYKCNECRKDFIRSSDLRKHERNMHTNNKPFQCSHCDKTFNRPLSLKRHERKHLGECPYSCPDCGKKFALQSRMAEHQKIHKGVRPYVCSVCSKCFTKSSNLTEHEAIHSGIRPHKCGECGVAFAMASRLVRHQYIHNIGQIHSCTGCMRNFSCLATLEQHQQLNCPSRIFVCVQCDKSFRCADKLAQHMLHHNDSIGPK
ncbi:hypothetical protein NQD34_002166 [Periophthalmus magnuspinnatus]|nr:hypothetical protein NQD34_002166 [Periophthalmus magnuspinnatus]